MTDQRIYQIALSQLYGIGPRRASHFLAKTHDLERIFRDSIRSLHKTTGIRESLLHQMKRDEALERAKSELTFIEKTGVTVHFYLDANYPRRLKQCADLPIVLYSYGNIDLNAKRTVAVVGTRHSTAYGDKLCVEFIQGLHDSNVQVISGLAYGIDYCAHQACVQKGIPTVAVFGHGLDRIYPVAHRSIARKMLANGGWISEFLSQTTPEREHFPMRNRIVAGMSDAVVVIESKLNGGSLITAALANDYQKDVFAFPGNIGQATSEGCNALIRENGAHLVTGSSDFLQQMGWHSENNTADDEHASLDIDPELEHVLEIIEEHPNIHIDSLAIRTATPIHQMNRILIELELLQLITVYPGNCYQRA